MIAKTDIILLLSELEETGIDTKSYESMLYSNSNILDILKFINSNKNLEVVKFYEKLRKSYNKKHSKLYGNIVKCDELDEINAKYILTTLTAFLNQIMQFDTQDQAMFLKHVRADEITAALKIYFSTFNLEPAYRLLKLIKADLVVSEYINNRRN